MLLSDVVRLSACCHLRQRQSIRCRAIAALAASFPAEGMPAAWVSRTSEQHDDPTSHLAPGLELLEQLHALLPLSRSVWTVRVAALVALRLIWTKVLSRTGPLQPGVTEAFDASLRAVEWNLQDLRYSAVRHEGVHVLAVMVRLHLVDSKQARLHSREILRLLEMHAAATDDNADERSRSTAAKRHRTATAVARWQSVQLPPPAPTSDKTDADDGAHGGDM